jgi:hypothetical protein
VLASGPLSPSSAQPFGSAAYDPNNERVLGLTVPLKPGAYRACLNTGADGVWLATRVCRTVRVVGNTAALVHATLTRRGLVLRATGPLVGRTVSVTWLFRQPPCGNGPYNGVCGQNWEIAVVRVRLRALTVITAPAGWSGKRQPGVWVKAGAFAVHGAPYSALWLTLPLS